MSQEALEERCLVFVYGTLKQGFPNSIHMPPAARYVGTAITDQRWPLVVDPEMGIPYMLHICNHPASQIVRGELYNVPMKAVKFLDEFEGVSIGLYIRSQLDVVCDSESTARRSRKEEYSQTDKMTAQAYFRSSEGRGPAWAWKWNVSRLLELPMVDEYSTQLAANFVPRGQRPV